MANYIFKDSCNHHSFYVGVYGSLSKKSKHSQMNELINVTNSTCAKLKHIPDRAVYSQGAFYISFFCKSLHKQ